MTSPATSVWACACSRIYAPPISPPSWGLASERRSSPCSISACVCRCAGTPWRTSSSSARSIRSTASGAALSYQSTGGVQRELALGAAASLQTPCADIEDFSEWERFLWTWRLAGVTAECHVMSHFRDRLAQRGFVTAMEAQQATNGQVVRVAGVNIRPHWPPTRSGKPVLFSSLEDETDILQLITFGEAIDKYTSVFLLSQAVMVEARAQRKGKGVTLIVQRAAPFRVPSLAPQVRQGYPARLAAPVVAR